MRELNQSGLTIKITKWNDDGTHDYSFLTSGKSGDSGLTTNSGYLYKQVKEVAEPEGFQLSRAKVFSSMDKSVDINVFSFENPDASQAPPSLDDTANIRAYMMRN